MLLVACPTLDFVVAWATLFASTSSYSSLIIKLPYNFEVAAGDHAVQVEWAMAVRSKAKTYFSAHNSPTGWFRHVSVSAQQQAWECSQSLWSFPESFTALEGWSGRSTGRHRCLYHSLISPPTMWVSDQNCTFGSWHGSDHHGVVTILVGCSY